MKITLRAFFAWRGSHIFHLSYINIITSIYASVYKTTNCQLRLGNIETHKSFYKKKSYKMKINFLYLRVCHISLHNKTYGNKDNNDNNDSYNFDSPFHFNDVIVVKDSNTSSIQEFVGIRNDIWRLYSAYSKTWPFKFMALDHEIIHLSLCYIYMVVFMTQEWIQSPAHSNLVHRRCSTKPWSVPLSKLLTHVKQGLQKYCETAYSRSGINQMWIFKSSKELLEHLKSPNFSLITGIHSFDLPTLYTTTAHTVCKDSLLLLMF